MTPLCLTHRGGASIASLPRLGDVGDGHPITIKASGAGILSVNSAAVDGGTAIEGTTNTLALPGATQSATTLVKVVNRTTGPLWRIVNLSDNTFGIDDLQTVLAAGNISGGTDIAMSLGDDITSVPPAGIDIIVALNPAGVPGALNIAGGAGVPGDDAGDVFIVGGAADAAGDQGGDVDVRGGVGGAGDTGGNTFVAGGAALAASGNAGGQAAVTGGAGDGGASGGVASLIAGAAGLTGPGAAAIVRASASGVGSGDPGGDVNLIIGAGDGVGVDGAITAQGVIEPFQQATPVAPAAGRGALWTDDGAGALLADALYHQNPAADISRLDVGGNLSNVFTAAPGGTATPGAGAVLMAGLANADPEAGGLTWTAATALWTADRSGVFLFEVRCTLNGVGAGEALTLELNHSIAGVIASMTWTPAGATSFGVFLVKAIRIMVAAETLQIRVANAVGATTTPTFVMATAHQIG